MARWKSPGHAYMPFFILGRVAGMSEDAIAAAWERKDPEVGGGQGGRAEQ